MKEYTFLQQLLGLFQEVDAAFSTMKDQFPAEVKCKVGCDDCCNACFTVSLPEAVLLNNTISSLPKDLQDDLKKRAEESQPELDNVLNSILSQSPEDQNKTLGSARIRCPFLLPDKSCLVYEFRPLTCRSYGLPISLGDAVHVCGFSGFGTGKTYPTIKQGNINTFLQKLSEEAVESLELPIKSDKRYFIHEFVLHQDIFDKK